MHARPGLSVLWMRTQTAHTAEVCIVSFMGLTSSIHISALKISEPRNIAKGNKRVATRRVPPPTLHKTAAETQSLLDSHCLRLTLRTLTRESILPKRVEK